MFFHLLFGHRQLAFHALANIKITRFFFILRKKIVEKSVAEPEPHLLVGAGAVTRCGSGGSGSDNGIKHSWELKNDTKCISL
jgi:hypothetical protein